MAFPKIDGYVVTEKLGSGSYSTVYKAHTKVGARSIVAIKCVDKSRIKNSGSAVDNLITEIRLLKTLSHPHIVHMKNFTWDDRNIYIIMEYCCGGDLSKYIHRYGRVPEKQVLYFLQQLASALKFLREKGVVHMDLKPHNLLLHKDSNGKYLLKVADFGFAQLLSGGGARAVRGSPLYMAPEMVAGRYDERVDLWSVGVIMFECLFGKAPYSSSTFQELLDKIQKQAPIEIPRNSSISAGCRDLVTRLLQHDPDQRISYEQFFAHEYLDLDHMPSKENYEKAVALMRRAVELDAAGAAAPALRAYSAALRLLVPAARAEPDPVRRAALSDKLARYMDRAEEIKEMLKGPRSVAPPTDAPHSRDTPATRVPHLAPHLAGCCGNNTGASTNSYDFNGMRTTCDPCTCTSNQNGSNTSVSGECSCGTRGEGQDGRDAESGGNESNTDTSPPGQQSSPASGRSRFGLKRLFGRQTSLPYLDSKDSSITDDNQSETKTQKDKSTIGDTNNDACRIT